jgi:hypothetical protein
MCSPGRSTRPVDAVEDIYNKVAPAATDAPATIPFSALKTPHKAACASHHSPAGIDRQRRRVDVEDAGRVAAVQWR